MANPVVHFEIVGPDPARLREFYSALFGWSAEPGSPVADGVSDPDQYAFVEPPGGIGIPGGIGGGAAYAARLVVYAAVPDVAAALDRAQALGGRRLLGPVRSPNGLVVGQFEDPAGTVMGVAEVPQPCTPEE